MKRQHTCFVAILALVSAVAADWPQFRGPNGTGVSKDTGLPIKWNKTENIRWKADLPGRGLSNPAIAGDRIFVTCSSGVKQDRLHVLCFNLQGEKLWERQFWATGNTLCHPKTCMAAPCPVTDGKRVFALFATADLAALDADGNLLWYRSLAGDYPTISNNVGMASSLVLYKDLLFVPMENVGDSFAAALDAATGQNRWRNNRTRDINWCTPALRTVGDQTEVLFQTEKDLTAFDPVTGKTRWTYQSQGLSSITTPVAVKDSIILLNGAALKVGKGDAQPEMLWEAPKLRSGYCTGIVVDDRLYNISGAGVLSCANVNDGKVVWQERLKGPFSASPVYAEGRIYAVNEAGVTQVVDVSGKEPKILASNEIGETILATPAIAHGAIYLRSDQHLFCIAAKQ